MSQPVLERRISNKAFIGYHAAAILVGLLIAAGGLIPGMWFLFVAAPIPWVCVLVYTYLARLGASYRLFPDRLEMERGILSHRIDNLELFRVRDVGLQQGLFGRIADFGDVYVHSTDASTPVVQIRGIDAPKEFYQKAREMVQQSRAQNRTVILEEGQVTAEP